MRTDGIAAPSLQRVVSQPPSPVVSTLDRSPSSAIENLTAEMKRKVEAAERRRGKRRSTMEQRWLRKFQLLRAFHSEHGHLCLPKDYEVESVKLDQWAESQRDYFRKLMKENSQLPQSIVLQAHFSLLNSIGFFERHSSTTSATGNSGNTSTPGAWNRKPEPRGTPTTSSSSGGKTPFNIEKKWNRNFDLLCSFRSTEGHCRVPRSYAVKSVKLGIWVGNQRRYYKNFKEDSGKPACITQERIDKLNLIGFEWTLRLNQSGKAYIAQQRINLLNSIGFEWKLGDENKQSTARYQPKKALDTSDWNWWFQRYSHQQQRNAFGQTTRSQRPLEKWADEQRTQYHRHLEGKDSAMSLDRIVRLNSIDFDWTGQGLSNEAFRSDV